MALDSVCTLHRLCWTLHQSVQTGVEYVGECKVLQSLTTFDITGSLPLLATTNIIVCGNRNRHFFFLILLVRDWIFQLHSCIGSRGFGEFLAFVCYPYSNLHASKVY